MDYLQGSKSVMGLLPRNFFCGLKPISVPCKTASQNLNATYLSAFVSPSGLAQRSDALSFQLSGS